MRHAMFRQMHGGDANQNKRLLPSSVQLESRGMAEKMRRREAVKSASRYVPSDTRGRR